MAHPLATKAISSARVKNDAVDAKTLAHLPRTNLLPEGWIAPPAVREARRLVRMRAALVRVRAKLKAQVHALLGEHGAQPEVVDLFSNKGREMLCLQLIDDVSLEIVIAEREIYQTIEEDERVKRLLPIPGIGPIIAATMLSEIGDVHRFQSADKLCAWAGLTPKEHSSADNIRRGHISMQGSRWLRWVMVEAAVHAF
jgi:transposase